jgi:hypothetical protein
VERVFERVDKEDLQNDIMKPDAVCLEPRWVLWVELSWFEYMH